MLDQPGIANSERPEGACVFLARDLEEAEWFAFLGREIHPLLDIWEVTLPYEFDLEEEPPAGTVYRESTDSCARRSRYRLTV
jgi:hypothetical protein